MTCPNCGNETDRQVCERCGKVLQGSRLDKILSWTAIIALAGIVGIPAFFGSCGLYYGVLAITHPRADNIDGPWKWYLFFGFAAACFGIAGLLIYEFMRLVKPKR